MITPTTEGRVPANTSAEINTRIKVKTREDVMRVAEGGPDAINQRLREIDYEWDVERTLEANAAMAVLLGSYLGATVDKKYFAIPAVVAGFLLMHAVEGWCPPLPILRRLGFRTTAEIDSERDALRAFRAGFHSEQPVNATGGME